MPHSEQVTSLPRWRDGTAIRCPQCWQRNFSMAGGPPNLAGESARDHSASWSLYHDRRRYQRGCAARGAVPITVGLMRREKRRSRHLTVLGWLAVLTASLLQAWPACAAASSECSDHLRAIDNALSAYQADHDDLPGHLSDLCTKYLPPAVLHCPADPMAGPGRTRKRARPPACNERRHCSAATSGGTSRPKSIRTFVLSGCGRTPRVRLGMTPLPPPSPMVAPFAEKVGSTGRGSRPRARTTDLSYTRRGSPNSCTPAGRR